MDNKLTIQPLKKRSKTQPQQYTIQKVIFKASQEKLFSKLLIQFSTKFNNKSLLNCYRKEVNNKFIQELKSPLTYNPEEALTHRQKFRKKVLKLLNNELDIDYFQNKKTPTGKYQITFKGKPIDDTKNLKPKKEFQIFKDFNEKKFKQSYMNMFDDKLQLKHQKLFRQQKYRLKTVQSLTEDVNNFQKHKYYQEPSTQTKQAKQSTFKIKQLKHKSTPKNISTLILKPKSHFKLKPHIEKLEIGKKLSDIEYKKIVDKVKLIGGYSTKIADQTLLLTKQSFSKYFKMLYERQHRLIDFLQIKPTLNLAQYKALCTRLNLMPIDHIIFMTFLYYDFNNDGFICENDLRRINQMALSKNNSIILQDVKLLKKKSQSFSYDESLQTKYIQLYKLPQITQTTYFLWRKQSQKHKQNNAISPETSEIMKIHSKKSTQRDTIQTQIQNNSSQKYIDELQLEGNTKQNKKFQKISKIKVNSFNPSILQNQSAEVRKYLLSIKKKKMYLNFQNFRNLYLLKQNKSITKPFLWYDMIDKIASIKYEGLRYQN